MKFALINGIKTEALKGYKGICPNCKAELIAKCGEYKIHHWAHKGIRTCDPWWENETEWHRQWKNNYPSDWQEISLLDENTKEIHIADIRTTHGLVIEFQHSHIDPVERISREIFYKKMVWVVDGTRLKRDYPRFLKEKINFRNTNNPAIFLVDFIEECFPLDWVGSVVPVIFDFRGNEIIEDPTDLRNNLYCLVPEKVGRYTFLMVLPRRTFIDSTTSDEWLLQMMSYLERSNQTQPVQPKKPMQNFSVRRESPYIFHRGRWIKRRRL